MTTKTILAAAIAATVAVTSAFAPSFAIAATVSGDAEVSATAVRTADLNLSSKEGAATLKARITGAVNRVCGTATGTIDIEQRRAINTCRAKARTAALAAARKSEDQALAQR